MKKTSTITAQNLLLEQYGLNLSALHDCTLCTFDYGEVILNQGEPVEYLFIVAQGKIKVSILAANGKDLTLCYYIDSGILGDVEIMQDNKFASATSIAAVPSVCMRIPLAMNEEYLTCNIKFMNLLAKGLSTKLLKSSNAHISSALYTGEERLCSYILIAEHKGVFADILTDVSRSIGISYRHLFRVLNDMCQRGVLEKTESGYVILDRQYLKKKCARM